MIPRQFPVTTQLCHCGFEANEECRIYKGGHAKLMCFDCAWDWLRSTSCCSKCGATARYKHNSLHLGEIDTEQSRCKCKPENGKFPSPDRGITPVPMAINVLPIVPVSDHEKWNLEKYEWRRLHPGSRGEMGYRFPKRLKEK